MSRPDDETPELDDVEYLRDLARRLFRIPVMYGTDQYDTDRLCAIARQLERHIPSDEELGYQTGA